MATRVSAAPDGAAVREKAARIEETPAHEIVEEQPLESARRRMPDKFKRFLLRVQGGKFYLPAAYRIVWFRDECPDWGIRTQIIEGGQEAGFATVRAEVVNPDGVVLATGHKTETRQDFPAGWVEKAETGAIARALSVAGFGTQFSPELDEEGLADSPQPIGGESYAGRQMSGGWRPREEPARPARAAAAVAAASEVWEGPGQCPQCHAPAGKRHGKPCVSA